ncbi:MAG: tetratricopeptide repeat protein [SAR324 cluster bacterium]|nr:tetratricopeptide repeat protein [SAR324 cluster bacterium]
MIIAIFCVALVTHSCGPSQEELTIGALKHFYRGNQLFSQNNPKSAIDEYKMAITLDDQQSAFYYNLGLAYYRLVLYELAIDAYYTAIKQKPDLVDAWYNLALAFDKIGETEKAFQAYEKYQKLNRVRDQIDPKPDQPKPVILEGPKTGAQKE